MAVSRPLGLESAGERSGENRMAMEFDLIPKDCCQGKRVRRAGGRSHEPDRTFYCVLYISDQIEQESVGCVDLGLCGWRKLGPHPISECLSNLSRRDSRCFDLTLVPEVNFIRAGLELNRGDVRAATDVCAWIASDGNSRQCRRGFRGCR